MNVITNDMEVIDNNSNVIDNNSNVIDSRDIIERIEELEELLTKEYEESDNSLTFYEYIAATDFEGDTLAAEYKALKYLAEQCKDAPDWKYGVTLIHYDYFTEYCKEMLEDCGGIPKDLPWYIEKYIDWEGVAKELKVDYYEVEFDDVIYYILW